MNANPNLDIDPRLLKAVIRFNTILTGIVMSMFVGAGMFFVTLLSLDQGQPDPAHTLNVLSVFMPGYEVSPVGAWIGLFWGGVIGAVIGAVLYRVYARNLPLHVANYLGWNRQDGREHNRIVPIGGSSLGMALGAVVALSLVLTTNWLVLRGTAHESVHARLLANYLPGYEVSLSGSLVGAAELFVIVYLACILWSWIYNRIISVRHQIELN